MIPAFTKDGILPPGRHSATLVEIRERFGSANAARRRLQRGLEAVVRMARRMGARELFLNGSYVTSKSEPGDWDAVLVVPVGARIATREAMALSDRPAVKEKFGGDLFTVSAEDEEVLSHFLDGVFVHDRDGRQKGIIVLRLK